MLNKDPNSESYYATGIWGKVTLDGLMRKAVQTYTDKIAVQDPLDRMNWTHGEPQSWSWGKLNAAVEQLSYLISRWKLPTQSRILVQLPNITELIIVYFACLRAECVPVIMDTLAGEYELRTIGEQCSASAVITLTCFGDMNPALQAQNIAFQVPSLRFLAAFGENCPDGILSLNEILSHPSGNALNVPPVRALPIGTEDKAAHMCAAVIDDKIQLVMRSHNQLLAGGMMTYLESQANAQEAIMLLIPALSVGAMHSAIVPWLLSQTPLVLHQPFDANTLLAQSIEHPQFRLIIPGRQLGLVQSHINDDFMPQAISCIWSNVAEYTQATQSFNTLKSNFHIGITDLVVINTIAASAIRRDHMMQCKPLTLGHHTAPRKVQGSPDFLTLSLSYDRKLVCNGPSVGQIYQSEVIQANSGLICEVNAHNEIINLEYTSRIAHIGGLCVSLAEIEAAFSDHAIINTVHAETLPDSIFGQRVRIVVTPRTRSLPSLRLLTLVERHLHECGFSSYKCGAEIDIHISDMYMHAKAS